MTKKIPKMHTKELKVKSNRKSHTTAKLGAASIPSRLASNRADVHSDNK